MKTKNSFKFPVGYQSFHKDQILNFRINQIYSLGYWTKADAQQVGDSIRSSSNSQQAFNKFAQEKDNEEEKLTAAFGYRLAEFFTPPDDPDKLNLYDQFIDRFYQAVQFDQKDCHFIPFQGGVLPALRFTLEVSKGTIVFIGGHDSFMEELYSVACYFVNAGYEVVLFEGPGQGAARRKSNLYMNHEWEKPTSTVLDYFGLMDITLVGLSMGGYLALRAGAFDERIARIVAFDVTPYDLHGSGLQGAMYRWLVKNPSVYNRIANFSMRVSGQANQLINQWMYITGANTPAEWNKELQSYSVSDVAERVTQDVLLMAGEKDQVVPIKEYYNNLNGLPNARSVTGRIFTTTENAEHHCQVGNIKLALDVILNWIENQS